MNRHPLACFLVHTIWMTTTFQSTAAFDIDQSFVYSEAYQDELLQNVSNQLDNLLKGYDKRLRPNFYGSPVQVLLNLHVSSISSISEVDMEFTVDFYLRQVWDDPRLKFSGMEEQLTISNEVLDKIWWPDTFFANAKSSTTHETTVKNAFLRIRNDGNVYFSLRLTVTASCYLDLSYFPMDTQCCTLEIESYGYSANEIFYEWLKQGNETIVKISNEVQLPQYKIVAVREINKIAKTSTGNYSRLSCEFYFERSLGWYIVQIYLPTNLIVLVSWVSFWLNRDAVPARVALGITAILTITTLISNTNSSLPKISYLKSIDIYLVVCFIMVFTSLLEYAAVCYIGKRCKLLQRKDLLGCQCNSGDKKFQENGVHFTKRDSFNRQSVKRDSVRRESFKRQRMKPVEEKPRWPITNNYETTYTVQEPTMHVGIRDSPIPEANLSCCIRHSDDATTCCCCLLRPATIDKYSRWLFPTVYVIFNACYWVIFLHVTKDTTVPKDARRL